MAVILLVNEAIVTRWRRIRNNKFEEIEVDQVNMDRKRLQED